MRFLAIDDNSVDLLIAKAAVQRFNPDFKIVTVESADEGITYLEQNASHLPDIILLDLNMPVKNGWDFLKELKPMKLTGIRVYILTSSINETEKLRADENPLVTGFLSKPLRLETLDMICNAAQAVTK